MEIVEVALRLVRELAADSSYIENEKWARTLGVQGDLDLDLKNLTLFNMKMVRPRKAIDLIAEILAMNMPIDALEAAQSKGKTALPNYKAAARMIWVRVRERLSEPISIQKEICERSKLPERMLLGGLMSMTMRSLNIPISAAGFAAILALMVAKIEFNAFTDEYEEDSC